MNPALLETNLAGGRVELGQRERDMVLGLGGDGILGLGRLDEKEQ